MAPIEDIGFPTLSEKLIELLRAIWFFIRDVCIAVWSDISQAFLTVWTWPPFETFRYELVTFFVSFKDYVVAHPVSAVAIAIFAVVVLPVVLVFTIVLVRAIVILVFVVVQAIVLLVFGVLSVLFDAITLPVLHCLGFRNEGVLLGSYAANYQSTSYGGNVPRSSTFAQFQSLGVKGGYPSRPVGSFGSSSWH